MVHLRACSLSLTKYVWLPLALLISTFAFAQTQPVKVTIDASKTAAPISKYIYGQFLEHIGGIVNNGIWAEMLDDRKFYFPITSHPPAEPAGQPRFRHATLRHWAPIGADDFVIMDSDRPYTGDHSPQVKLEKVKRTDSCRADWPCAMRKPTRAESFWRAAQQQ